MVVVVVHRRRLSTSQSLVMTVALVLVAGLVLNTLVYRGNLALQRHIRHLCLMILDHVLHYKLMDRCALVCLSVCVSVCLSLCLSVG